MQNLQAIINDSIGKGVSPYLSNATKKELEVNQQPLLVSQTQNNLPTQSMNRNISPAISCEKSPLHKSMDQDFLKSIQDLPYLK